MVKNLPSKARDVASISGCETKIPHVAEQLSLCTTTTELYATAREPVRRNKRFRVPQLRPHAAINQQIKVHIKKS